MNRHIELAAHIAKAPSRLGSSNRFVAAGWEIDKVASSEIAFVIFLANHNLPMAVGDEFGLLAKKYGVCPTTVPVAPPGGGKNTNYRFSRFFVRSVPLFRSLMLTPMLFRKIRSNRPLCTMTSDIETTRGARCTMGVSGVADRLLTSITMPEALVSFPEVDIKWTVVDKNTWEALRRWLSCRGITTIVAESHSTIIIVRILLTTLKM